MALINCPECNHEMSNKATACPNCGYPINETNSGLLAMQNDEELVCPDFPEDLSMGKSVGSIGRINFVLGEYESIGKMVAASLYKNGIKITSYRKPLINIHKSQIISLEELTEEQIITQDKSVIGRAIIGGILTGGIGAIVGGMSGLGSKKIDNSKYYFIINYWDIDTKETQSIVIKCDRSYKDFIKLYKERVQEI